jgi:hypothetical protein
MSGAGAGLAWWPILAAIVTGQMVSTVWFVVLFGDGWAREFGAATKAEHTKQIPPYTYAVGLACTTLLTIGLAWLQARVDIESIGDALILGGVVTVVFAVATALPGYAFLKRWRAFAYALGCQAVMILAISVVLGAFR